MTATQIKYWKDFPEVWIEQGKSNLRNLLKRNLAFSWKLTIYIYMDHVGSTSLGAIYKGLMIDGGSYVVACGVSCWNLG